MILITISVVVIHQLTYPWNKPQPRATLDTAVHHWRHLPEWQSRTLCWWTAWTWFPPCREIQVLGSTCIQRCQESEDCRCSGSVSMWHWLVWRFLKAIQQNVISLLIQQFRKIDNGYQNNSGRHDNCDLPIKSNYTKCMKCSAAEAFYLTIQSHQHNIDWDAVGQFQLNCWFWRIRQVGYGNSSSDIFHQIWWCEALCWRRCYLDHAIDEFHILVHSSFQWTNWNKLNFRHMFVPQSSTNNVFI